MNWLGGEGPQLRAQPHDGGVSMLLKRENPLKYKVTSEQDGGLRKTGPPLGMHSEQHSHREESGTELYKVLGTIWYLSGILSTVLSLAQMIQENKNLTWLFPGVLCLVACLAALCSWNLLWRKRLSKLVFVWALSYQAHRGG